MSDLEKVFTDLKHLNYDIGNLLKQSTYTEYDDMSGLKIDYRNEEQLFLLDEFREILQKLEEAKNSIDYLQRPVFCTGALYKNQSGRYELDSGKYYTSGSSIEFLCSDDRHCYYDEHSQEYKSVPYWVKTRVEHDGNDYYLVGYKSISMNGLEVRERWQL